MSMKSALFFLIPAIPLLADAGGAGSRLTGAPGEQTCVRCHSGTALNAGGGSVTISAGSSYAPGVKQRLTVTVVDAAMRRFGFQLSTTSGTLAAVDSNVRITSGYANQTSAGTAVSAYEVDWTPAASATGTVTLHAAGLAANSDGRVSGDRVYTTSLTVNPAASNAPAIRTGGVVNGASFQAVIAPNSWITIAGDNLSATTRSWTAAELTGGALPTALDGVSVTVNGQAASVAYISPGQINAIAPADETVGPVEVRVISNGQTSAAATAMLNAVTPALFTIDGKYAATANSPAKPGETIVLYANGLGATTPAVTAGRVTDAVAPLAVQLTVTIGGQPATVAFAGLVPPFARLYQVNVEVPGALPDGDHAVILQTAGAVSPATTLLTVKR